VRVSDVGEFGLIELLSKTLGQSGAAELLLGIGDDAAAWRSPESITLATTDTLIEGIHFTPQLPWKALGWKALAINLSDIAAMGGIPQYALVALAVPGDREVSEVVQLYEGIAEAASEFGVTIVGGNVSGAATPSITLTLIGEANKDGILTRSAAKPGEKIAVTGHLGASAAGQRMLSEDISFGFETARFLTRAHSRPQPRVAEGQILASSGVRAAIDISDGLLLDLGHICEASQVGATVQADRLPIHSMTRAAFEEEALNLALAGGEDYELLFTADQQTIEAIQERIACPTTIIGEITSGGSKEVTVVDEKGYPLSPSQKGWDHFSQVPSQDLDT
jgi:thiamine-monophosphate kinase